MKKTARVIVTYRCDRKCENCCNEHIRNVPEVQFEDLLEYDEIVITGGEPMLIAPRVVEMVHRLQANGFTGNIYLYTAMFKRNHWAHKTLVKEVTGITYTLHFPVLREDVVQAYDLNQYIRDNLDNQNNSRADRLFYDSRCWLFMDEIMKGTQNANHWTEVRSLRWKDGECPVPEHEELLFYDLEKE